MSKYVVKFRERDYDDEYEVSDKKRKKQKHNRKNDNSDYNKLVSDDNFYYEKPSRSKSRRAY